jgi:excisionase family DNA binding protein
MVTSAKGNEEITETMLVVETHATDEQLIAHRDELEHLAKQLAAIMGVEEIIVELNNRNQPVTVETPPQRVYSTEQAAEYLGVSVPTVKHHVHNLKDLAGDKVGPTLYFTQDELDRFKAQRRPRGRPKQ